MVIAIDEQPKAESSPLSAWATYRGLLISVGIKANAGDVDRLESVASELGISTAHALIDLKLIARAIELATLHSEIETARKAVRDAYEAQHELKRCFEESMASIESEKSQAETHLRNCSEAGRGLEELGRERPELFEGLSVDLSCRPNPPA